MGACEAELALARIALPALAGRQAHRMPGWRGEVAVVARVGRYVARIGVSVIRDFFSCVFFLLTACRQACLRGF